MAEADSAVFGSRWAVIVGVNTYEHLNPLKYCVRDASEVKEALIIHLEFPDDQIFVFSEKAQRPTRANILQKLGELTNLVNEDDLLLFYFSGHGFREKGKDFLLPPEAGPTVLQDTAIDAERVVELLSDSGCKNVVMFLDACRKETGDRAPGAGIGEDSTSVGQATAEAASRKGVVTFFSCDPKDRSWEIDELEHGSFTHCVLQAMRAWECNTVEDIDGYLRANVPALNRHYKKDTQQPYTILKPAEKGKLPIFRLPRGLEKFNKIEEALADRYFAKDEPGSKYYDMAINVLERAKKVAPDSLDRKRIRLCEQLCANELTVVSFERTWEAADRRDTKPTPISKDMGRLR